MQTNPYVLVFLVVIGVVTVTTTAHADVAPPDGYVEKCTLEKTCPVGKECLVCPGSYEDYFDTPFCEKTYSPYGYTGECSSWGGSFWTEIWCRPVSNFHGDDSGLPAEDAVPHDSSIDAGQLVEPVICSAPETEMDASTKDAKPDASTEEAVADANEADSAVKSAADAGTTNDNPISPTAGEEAHPNDFESRSNPTEDAAASLNSSDSYTSLAENTETALHNPSSSTAETGAITKDSDSQSSNSCSLVSISPNDDCANQLGLMAFILLILSIRREYRDGGRKIGF